MKTSMELKACTMRAKKVVAAPLITGAPIVNKLERERSLLSPRMYLMYFF